jgi:hypothetical protein
MDYDTDKVDDAVLALLHLTSFALGQVRRAWKGHDWEALNRLHARGLISDPRTKAKSVLLSEQGVVRAERLFAKHFGTSPPALESEKQGG